jgi:hypothetical protein
MSSSVSEETLELYCIDTSALLHGWRRDYPPDVFASVWTSLESLIARGTLIAPEEVLLELERGGDDVYDWAKAHNSMFVQPDAAVQAQVESIVNGYRSFLPNESHDGVWADPYVLGLAMVRGATVVTGEKPAGPNAKRPKIPNICINLGIPYTDLLGILRACGWQF